MKYLFISAALVLLIGCANTTPDSESPRNTPSYPTGIWAGELQQFATKDLPLEKKLTRPTK